VSKVEDPRSRCITAEQAAEIAANTHHMGAPQTITLARATNGYPNAIPDLERRGQEFANKREQLLNENSLCTFTTAVHAQDGEPVGAMGGYPGWDELPRRFNGNCHHSGTTCLKSQAKAKSRRLHLLSVPLPVPPGILRRLSRPRGGIAQRVESLRRSEPIEQIEISNYSEGDRIRQW